MNKPVNNNIIRHGEDFMLVSENEAKNKLDELKKSHNSDKINFIKEKCWKDISDNLSIFDKSNELFTANIIRFIRYKFKLDENSILKHVPWLENSKNIVKNVFKKEKVDKIGVSNIREILPKNNVDLVMSSWKKLSALNKGENKNPIGQVFALLSQNSQPNSELLFATILEFNKELFFDDSTKKYYTKVYINDKNRFKEISVKHIIDYCNIVFGDNSKISRKTCEGVLKHITKAIKKDYNLLEFSNGTYITKRGEEEFRRNWFSSERIPKITFPFNWNPESYGFKIKDTVEKTLECNMDGFEDNLDAFYKCLGNALMATNEKDVMVVIVGPPGSGKSTLLTMIQRLGKCSFIPIPKIVKNERFQLTSCVGTDFLLDDDLHSGQYKNIGNLRTFITAGGLEVEIKGVNERIILNKYNTPKIFSCGNELPIINEKGFKRRLVLIKAENVINPKNVDDMFQNDILNGDYDEELEWLVYTAITKYINDRDKPIVTKEHKNAMFNEYKIKSNPLPIAISEIFEFPDYESEKSILTNDEVHNEIKKWLKLKYEIGVFKSVINPSNQQYNKAMDTAGYSSSKKKVKNRQVKCYSNIKITSKWKKIKMNSLHEFDFDTLKLTKSRIIDFLKDNLSSNPQELFEVFPMLDLNEEANMALIMNSIFELHNNRELFIFGRDSYSITTNPLEAFKKQISTIGKNKLLENELIEYAQDTFDYGWKKYYKLCMEEGFLIKYVNEVFIRDENCKMLVKV